MQTGKDVQRKTKTAKENFEFLSCLPPALLPVLHGETRPHLVRHSDAVTAAAA